MNRGAQVYAVHGELRDSRCHTACEAGHGEEEVRAVQIEGVGDGVQAEGLSHSTRLQLLVQILLNEPQVLSFCKNNFTLMKARLHTFRQILELRGVQLYPIFNRT